MTQEIKPTYVTFEQAKWFYEKGFNEQCLAIYQDGEILQLKSTISNSQFMTSRNYTAPEQHVVVEWLRVNHGIWVQGPFPINNGKWEWVIFLLNEPLENTDGYKNIMSLHTKQRQFNSPQEAYSAAFDYILNNLIW